ncbi:hypothetical protein WR25_02185 [Diploscapter pachys]|uniref:Uncharacterized protein n=1 Tax=Diploscapter pachys TaxID=2018661 RepID=A0A2A2KQJ8_9BILA|nr:hypothetical protein WR25_02185 [Diploscapter pachys]
MESREDSGEFLTPPQKPQPYMLPYNPPLVPQLQNGNTSYQNGSQNGHISLDMEGEPRRYGAGPRQQATSIGGQAPWPDSSTREDPQAQPRTNLYQRRQSGESNGGGRYNVPTGTAVNYNRNPSSSLQV